jgi:hypothetical protein
MQPERVRVAPQIGAEIWKQPEIVIDKFMKKLIHEGLKSPQTYLINLAIKVHRSIKLNGRGQTDMVECFLAEMGYGNSLVWHFSENEIHLSAENSALTAGKIRGEGSALQAVAVFTKEQTNVLDHVLPQVSDQLIRGN